jgi:signal transduction histidine kinase
VFDDFYRADNALTRTTSGTGIGLALVKKLVQAMGGKVRAANDSGGGCTVTIVLPAKQ